MNDEKAKIIARAALEIGSGGEWFVWAGLTHISKKSGIPRKTTYRYLEKMVTFGLMEKEEHLWRGETSWRYRVTSAGKYWLGIAGERVTFRIDERKDVLMENYSIEVQGLIAAYELCDDMISHIEATAADWESMSPNAQEMLECWDRMLTETMKLLEKEGYRMNDFEPYDWIKDNGN